jgi:hypothetical protein
MVRVHGGRDEEHSSEPDAWLTLNLARGSDGGNVPAEHDIDIQC